LEKREEQVLPGSKGDGREREGVGVGGRIDPNNVCTYELMNKEEKETTYLESVLVFGT
jgi:hypothetical protein